MPATERRCNFTGFAAIEVHPARPIVEKTFPSASTLCNPPEWRQGTPEISLPHVVTIVRHANLGSQSPSQATFILVLTGSLRRSLSVGCGMTVTTRIAPTSIPASRVKTGTVFPRRPAWTSGQSDYDSKESHTFSLHFSPSGFGRGCSRSFFATFSESG